MLTKEVLEKAGEDGSAKVSEAFSLLSGADVEVSVSAVDTKPLNELLSTVEPPEGHAVVTYAPLLGGMHGTAVLMMTWNDALALVDLLNKRTIGSTVILKEIDRSAIKETLNILSNSYTTVLADSSDIKLGVDVPVIVTSGRLKDIISALMMKDSQVDDVGVMFETVIKFFDHSIHVGLYVVVNKDTVA